MDSSTEVETRLSDMTIHVKVKLSALWATTVLCYIYGDLFGFFKQQTLTDIVSGKSWSDRHAVYLERQCRWRFRASWSSCRSCSSQTLAAR